jgi:hypothetical protein
MKRRHLLQSIASTLATLGWSQWEIRQQGLRYARVLAQGTPRKLALLVGINAYPASSLLSPLKGCVTDVELQRHLLLHRFGFNPQDILTLTDQQATRQGILTAFEEHLIKQAKPGDVVVFHFSGHGSQVADPDRDTPDGLNSTFLPVDSVLPPGFPSKGGTVKDIMGHTLFLLMYALQTENVTVVLDSCHSGGGTRGNLRIRSRSGGNTLEPDPLELDYQKQWLTRLNLSPQEFMQRRRQGIARGVAIASAKRDQLAADAPFSDFYAGAFTYLMTQYLWQEPGTAVVNSAIPTIARSTTRLSSSEQEPIFEVKPGSRHEQQLIYFSPKQTVPAEAVITKVEGDRAELWLGGLAPQSLTAFNRDAILTAVDSQGRVQGQVKLEGRNGLVGQGKLLSAAKPGSLLQEQVRGIPTDLSLLIGLGSSLGRDMDEARQALQALRWVTPVPLQQGEVHFILERTSNGSIGLFSPGMDAVPGSFGAAREAIAAAITRLQPKFKTLLAAQLFKLTLNSNSSRLNVTVTMTPMGQKQVIASALTNRAGNVSRTNLTSMSSKTPTRLPIGTSVQLSLRNHESRDLYFNVLVIGATGEMSVIFPNQWTASSEVMRVKARQTLLIPNTGDPFKLVTQAPAGMTEVLIIASSSPLEDALSALQKIAARGGQSRGFVALNDLNDPADIISSLLDDVNAVSRNRQGTPTIRTIDTSQTATLSLSFEVV